MKRLLTLTLLVLGFGVGFLETASAQKADEIISSYTGANAVGFLRPLADVLTSTFNTGHAHKTSIDSGFHIYIGATAFVTGIYGDKLKYFTGTTDRNFTPQQSAQASTILGPSKPTTLNGSNGTSYTFPAGLGLRFFTLAVPQVTIGNLMGTEFNARFIAVDLGGDFGKIQLIGGGIRHDLTQYIMPHAPLKVSVEYCFQQFKVGNYVELTMHKAGLYAGQQGKIFNYYGYIGYQQGQMNFRYNDTVDASPVDITVKNQNPLLLGVGAGMKLWIFRLHAQASFISPIVVAGGFGLNF